MLLLTGLRPRSPLRGKRLCRSGFPNRAVCHRRPTDFELRSDAFSPKQTLASARLWPLLPRLRAHHPQIAGFDGGPRLSAGHVEHDRTTGLCRQRPAPARAKGRLLLRIVRAAFQSIHSSMRVAEKASGAVFVLRGVTLTTKDEHPLAT